MNLAELDMQNQPDGTTAPEFSIILPLSKAEVVFKLLTRADELQIEKEVKSLRKINSEVDAETTTRLKAMIVSVNGDTAKNTIWNFVDKLLVRDARYFRETYKNIIPDVNFNIPVDFSCGTNETVRLPIGTNFFWPDSRI